MKGRKERNERIGSENDVTLLRDLARIAMRKRGMTAAFSKEVLFELSKINGPVRPNADDPDLRRLPWCSIDNDDSKDLDQLTVAVPGKNGVDRVLVAIAEVDGLVPLGSAIDRHAYINTTSVYPPGHVFPMLPERLSTDLTSLNPDEDRVAIVTDMAFDAEGSLVAETVYRALVRNYAKLTYNAVGPWLEGKTALPEAISSVNGLDENLRIQNRIAKALRRRRDENGALNFMTIQGKANFENGQIVSLSVEERNDAKDLIEDLMIAVNGVTARFLSKRGFPTLRRVVKTPRRWDRIQAVAAQYDVKLPDRPDSKALNQFLEMRREADPRRFPDLSLTVIKLLGSGEYAAERAGSSGEGHFGLAAADYAHSTAPNRRYPDLITQRLLKAVLAGEKSPYSYARLVRIAARVTEMEDTAAKVERQIYKSAAALLLKRSIGETFEGFVTGAAEKGTWVRILSVPVEGRVVQGETGLDVGDFIRVVLVSVDVEKGHIDFRRV